MDPEEIVKRVAELKLSSEAKDKRVTLTASDAVDGKSRARKIILGKIFSERLVNREALRENLPSVFRPRGTMEKELVGRNIFAATFDLESDREHILTEGPWHYFNELMILQETDTKSTAANAEFDKITLWVQLHNMPITCMEASVVRRIGEQIGRVIEVDCGAGGMCLGRYARVKISRSIHEPLTRCVPLVVEGEEEDNLILVLYERLPDQFCYACGKLGHYLKSCSLGEKEKKKAKFGPWLRAGCGVDYRKQANPKPQARSQAGNPLLVARANVNGPRPLPPSG
ncbi:uncharacterized protein LOC131023260 [Salvia miltiorrhiza]|uniref:uncharacterized protein LOC131023260 n=1 Tax=Salvia miltiorrhiza TaxID=226208 RepID=UPI0025AD7CB8|nr:uncharacterized protein LOC131023260 [Salvia miltiorrhiza]